MISTAARSRVGAATEAIANVTGSLGSVRIERASPSCIGGGG